MYSFQEQLRLAKEYEEKILTYYSSLSSTVSVSDLTSKKKYQDLDIDFLHLKLDKVVLAETIEIKVDFRMGETGNFFIEIDGWYDKCKAETIMYVNVARKLAYHLNNQKLHEFIDKQKDKYRTVKVDTSDFGGYSVTGILVPYQDILDAVIPYVEDLTKVI